MIKLLITILFCSQYCFGQIEIGPQVTAIASKVAQEKVDSLAKTMDTVIVIPGRIAGSNVAIDKLEVPVGKTAIFVLTIKASASNGTGLKTGEKEVAIKNIGGVYSIVSNSDIVALKGDTFTLTWAIVLENKIPVVRLSGTVDYTLVKQIIQ